jgi:uncharacterized protein (DUF2235 family)
MSPNNLCERAKAPKNIAVFCDGTWNKPDQASADGGKPSPTNVAKLFESIYPCDGAGNPQLVHYILGVGTRTWERVRGGGFGYGISNNIKEGYKFICSNYEPGDRIFLFGFSRGAFTARSIAGFIHNMGILRRSNFYMIDEAYDHYRDHSPEWKPGSPQSVEFQKTYCCEDKRIHFIGVWDTVGALGAPYGVVAGWIVNKLFKCRFHDTKLSSTIQAAAHAVAIDEKRWPFRPTLWQLSSSHNPANFEERWFPGVHSDVGGGYPETGVADIALDWMAAKASGFGLCLDLNRVSNPPVVPDPAGARHNSQTWYYRIVTMIYVKIPSLLWIPLPGISRDDTRRIDFKGDYNRKITEGAATGHIVTALTQCCTGEAPAVKRKGFFG